MIKIRIRLNIGKLGKAFVLGIVVSACLTTPVNADSPNDIINQMLSRGFNAEQANLLFGQWSDTKKLLIGLAKSGDQQRIKLAHDIVSQRFSSWEQTWTSVVDDMVNKGYQRPVDAMAPTGGWKKPLAYQNSDPVRFIIDSANADIDATFFGSNPSVAEEFVERTAIKWAERTSGTSALLPDGTPNYTKINEVLKNSEITPFPRHPDGSLSNTFQNNFPEIVHEGYPGAYGQRSLEIDYLLTDKGKADIVRYDSSGNPVKSADGRVQVVRDQPAANVIEDLSNARYTRMDRINRLSADYTEKYVKHLGAGAARDAETTAKMLQRMIEGDSTLQGINSADHPLYSKAKAVKEALREGDDILLRKALKGQSLDDFLADARTEIERINAVNKSRLTGMLDDNIGTAASSRLNTAMRGLVAIGYGVVAADALLKAREGEGGKEVGKALAAALAADLAGMSAGSAAGAAAAGTQIATLSGFGAGLAAAMIAGIVVNGAIEWTEEGINNIVSGYKEGATLQGIFLQPGNIDNFLSMSPEEIKRIIDSEWEEQYQWGGAYVGKSGDKKAQERLKKSVFEQAMAIQNRMNNEKLIAQLSAEIVKELLTEIAAKLDRGEITEERAEELRKNLGARVNETLADRYGTLLEKLSQPPGKPGLLDTLVGPSKAEREKARANADSGFGDLMNDKGYLEGLLGDFDIKAQALIDALTNGADTAEGLFEQLQKIYRNIIEVWASIESSTLVILNDINKSYGTDDDLAVFNQRKGQIAAILTGLWPKVDEKREMMDRLRKLMEGLGGIREASFIQELEDYLQRVVANCGLPNEQEQIAYEPLNKARSASDRIVTNVNEIAEYIGLLEKGIISKCENADQLKADAIKSAQDADQWGKRAKQGFDGAMILVRSCSNAKSIEEADRLFESAKALGYQALSKYEEAQQTLNQLTSGIKDANDQLDDIDRLMRNVETDRVTFNNYSDSFDTVIDGIERLKGVCESSKNEINERLAEIVGQEPALDDHSEVVAIRQQIETITDEIDMTSITKEMDGVRAVVEAVMKIYEEQKKTPGSMRSLLKSCKLKDNDPLTTALRDAGWTLLELEDYVQWETTFKNTKNECLSVLGIDDQDDQGKKKVDKLYVVFRVEGNGFTPHWAGASYRMSGYDQVLVVINRSAETPEQRRVALRNLLLGNACDIKNPPGFVWKQGRPMIWDGGPVVTTIAVEESPGDIDEALLVDAWKFDGDDPRSLYELRKELNCD